MKKDPNYNSMNGTTTMPSYFPCIKSSESHPRADFLKPTYMFQLDFDHVKKEDMEQLIQLVRGDNHTMVEYITVSGRGFRVFCAYRPVDDDDICVFQIIFILSIVFYNLY